MVKIIFCHSCSLKIILGQCVPLTSTQHSVYLSPEDSAVRTSHQKTVQCVSLTSRQRSVYFSPAQDCDTCVYQHRLCDPRGVCRLNIENKKDGCHQKSLIYSSRIATRCPDEFNHDREALPAPSTFERNNLVHTEICPKSSSACSKSPVHEELAKSKL